MINNLVIVIIIGYILYLINKKNIKQQIQSSTDLSDSTDLTNNIIFNNNNNNNNKLEDISLDKVNQNSTNLDNNLKSIFKKNTTRVQKTFSNNLNKFEENSSLPKVYLNIKAGKKDLGQIIIKLFTNNVPKTCQNFIALCTGEQGYTRQGKKLSYKNCPFHRIIPGFMIQGGDIENNDGTGKMSIYSINGSSFPDENFMIHHNKPGIVSMANSGPDSNGCQFFITTDAQPHLDGKHVAFGQVIKGIDIIKEIDELGTESGKPLVNVEISDCGLI